MNDATPLQAAATAPPLPGTDPGGPRTEPEGPRGVDRPDPLAPWFAGSVVIGLIDEVNGPSSRLRPAEVSVHEARLLARHWAARVTEVECLAAEGVSGSWESRMLSYAWRRLNALEEAGLLPGDELACTLNTLRRSSGLPAARMWAAHAAAGQPGREPAAWPAALTDWIRHLPRLIDDAAGEAVCAGAAAEVGPAPGFRPPAPPPDRDGAYAGPPAAEGGGPLSSPEARYGPAGPPWRKARFPMDLVLQGCPGLSARPGIDFWAYWRASSADPYYKMLVYALPGGNEPGDPHHGMADRGAGTFPRPGRALEHFVDGLMRGDGPAGLLTASLLARGVADLARDRGHPGGWRDRSLLLADPWDVAGAPNPLGAGAATVGLLGEWVWSGERPTSWEPSVRIAEDGSATVAFYTVWGRGPTAIRRHLDHYAPGGDLRFVQHDRDVGFGPSTLPTPSFAVAAMPWPEP